MRGSSPQTDPFYLSSRWKHLRNAVMRRDGYQCQISKRYKLAPVQADLVHHIFPRQWWPEYQYESWNLISVCRDEHNALHDRGSDRLTAKGMALLIRTARKRGMDIDSELEKYKH